MLFFRPKPIISTLRFRDREFQIERKAYSREISVKVYPSGKNLVKAGKGVGQFELENFLLKNWSWLESQWDYFKDLKNRFPKRKFINGGFFPILGKEVQVRFDNSTKRFSYKIFSDHILLLFSAKNMTPKQAIQRFYKEAGSVVLKERVDKYSKEMNLYAKKISFRSQKTRWGSCSSNGHISLNWRLLGAPIEVIDYVIVHELAHLKHMNHSKVFWSLVQKHSPNFKQKKKWLESNQFAFDFLAQKSELYNDA